MLHDVNVLVVDDNPLAVSLLTMVLEDSYATICSAGSIKEAFDKLNNKKIDIILLDLDLPDNKDIKIVGEFQKVYPQIPVVIITGIVSQDLNKQAISYGAQDILIKGNMDSEKIVLTVYHSIERQKRWVWKNS